MSMMGSFILNMCGKSGNSFIADYYMHAFDSAIPDSLSKQQYFSVFDLIFAYYFECYRVSFLIIFSWKCADLVLRLIGKLRHLK